MSNAQKTNTNLTLNCGPFGLLAVQPVTSEAEQMHDVQFVVFPHRIPSTEFAAAVEWASSSEAPIFITPQDLNRFQKEGFGSYRFHLLEGFREIGFSKGKIKFIPAAKKRMQGFWGFAMDLADAWRLTKRDEFHVVIKPESGDPILYLASPFLDKTEWALLTEDEPRTIVGSRFFSNEYWIALSEKLGIDIEINSGAKPYGWRSEISAALSGKRVLSKGASVPGKKIWNKKDFPPS